MWKEERKLNKKTAKIWKDKVKKKRNEKKLKIIINKKEKIGKKMI